MAGLQQKKIKDSYKSLLRVDDDNNGIDGSLADITDGEGTIGPFRISSTEVAFPASSTLKVSTVNANSATEGFHLNLTNSTTNNLNLLSIPDNVDGAFIIQEGGNQYMKFATTNGSEIVEFGKDVEMQGNLQVNGTIAGSSINFNSVDMDNVDIDSGTIDGTTIGASSASTGAFTTLTASGDVNFDSNTLFVDASENKVSIGTTSPLTYGGYHPAKFSVDGESFTGSMAVTEYQDGISGGLLAIGHSRGTIASKAKLNQNDIAGRLLFSGYNGTDFRTITGEIRSTVTTATASIADGVMAGNLEFRTNAGASDDASVAMTIDSSQRVGIGITSPSSYHSSTQLAVGNTSGEGQITIVSGSSNDANINFADGTTGTAIAEGIIRYKHSNNQMELYTGQALALTIDSSQRVGIGVSPTTKFEVQDGNGIPLRFGDVASTPSATAGYIGLSTSAYSGNNGDLVLIPRTSASSNILLMEGNVGINDTSPTSDSGYGTPVLSVKGSTFPALAIRNSTSGGEGILSTGNAAGLQLAIAGNATASDNYIIFRTGNTNSNFNSTERMRITSAGNVGIGTTSPSSYNSNTNNLVIRDSGTGGITISTGASNTGFVAFNDGEDTTVEGLIGYNQSNDSMYFRTASVDDRLYIDNLGNVGIGSGSNTNARIVRGFSQNKGLVIETQQPAIQFVDTADTNKYFTQAYDNGDMYFHNNASGFIKFSTNGSERMRIKSTGQIETNYGDSSYNLYINGLASSSTKGILMAVGGSSGTVDQMLFRDGNSHNCGAITSDASANTTNYGGTSDYRLKENEEIIPDGLERLNRLKPYRFNFISAPEQTQDGFFAHELAEHIPEAVVGTKDEMEDVLYEAGDDIPEGSNVGDVKETVIKPQMVDYGKITPLIVKALQEADDKIDELTARIEALENA